MSLEDALRLIVREELERIIGAPHVARTQSEYVSVTALATALGVSPPTVRKMVDRGCPHIKPGDHPRFRIDEVESWLRGGANGQTQGS